MHETWIVNMFKTYIIFIEMYGFLFFQESLIIF